MKMHYLRGEPIGKSLGVLKQPSCAKEENAGDSPKREYIFSRAKPCVTEGIFDEAPGQVSTDQASEKNNYFSRPSVGECVIC
jgi:hypothetical protein